MSPPCPIKTDQLEGLCVSASYFIVRSRKNDVYIPMSCVTIDYYQDYLIPPSSHVKLQYIGSLLQAVFISTPLTHKSNQGGNVFSSVPKLKSMQ